MSDKLRKLTADIVSAHVANNAVSLTELPIFIASVYSALARAGASIEPEAAAKPKGAVSIRQSLSDPSKIISMIDGKAYIMLKRHLTRNGYTPKTYREAFGLPHSYPMTAPAYVAIRSDMSKTYRLGQKKANASIEPIESADEATGETVKGLSNMPETSPGEAAAIDRLDDVLEESAPEGSGRSVEVVPDLSEPELTEGEPKRIGWWSKSA